MRESVLQRRFGAALGAAGGPAAGFGAHWSGIGDGRVHIWLLATVIGMLLGALTWRVFLPEPEALEAPGVGFNALFGGSVGMLAGAFVAFPMGGFMGACGGAAGAAAGTLLWRASPQLGSLARPLATAFFGCGVGVLFAMWWTT